MSPPDVRYEFNDKPPVGTTLEIAAGVHWLRMPLPFALNHINLWLFEDGRDWALIDTGLGDETSQAHWQDIFKTTMDNRPLTQLLVTHMHPDHVGCAGFLARHFDVDLCMSREEYLLCRILVSDTGREAPEEGVDFYRAAGYDDAALARYRKMFGYFGRYVTPLPNAFTRLTDGMALRFGNHQWEVLIGRGHSPEHACLYCKDQNLLVAGDQILPAISANVSVYPTEPQANPLREWLRTLVDIRERVPEDVLVLPAHGKPFRGVRQRIDAIVTQHRSRLVDLQEFCREPRRAVDVFPALYRRKITQDNLMFATGEALAHLNYLKEQGQLRVQRDTDKVDWYVSN